MLGSRVIGRGTTQVKWADKWADIQIHKIMMVSVKVVHSLREIRHCDRTTL